MATQKSIMIAEDDQFYLNIYKTKFKNEDFEVITAENGEIALKLLEERTPDLLLIDLVMPVKNGFDTLKELRANPKFKDLKVVVMSNLGQEEDKEKTKEFNILDYIVKANSSIADVVEKIKSHLA